MPRRCTVCDHPQREAIDKALVEGQSSNLALSALHGVSESALRRHKKRHVPASLALAQDAHEVAQADNLLDQLEGLRREAHAIKDLALGDSEYRTALTGIRELVRIVELMAKVRGELAQEGAISIILAPEWVALRTVILTALTPFPEARLAVARAVGDGHAGA